MNVLNDFIKEGWGKARKMPSDSDLDLPCALVPPSIKGDFRTLYYWDTYFTNIGLILDGYTAWAKDNVDNLLYALDIFGCVPNFTRKNGADFCSQPPLLCLMIQDIYSQTKDEHWLARTVRSLEKEYAFWMTERITEIGLNQYGCNAKNEDALLWYYGYASKRVQLPQDISVKEKIEIAKNFLAEGESGEDYTPRYARHNALDYVQIDLNAHLYGVEDFLSRYFDRKDDEKSAYYAKQKARRLELIERYCYNETTGVYCDYNFVEGKKNAIICCACFLPYYYGFARKNTNLLSVYNVLKSKGGVVACQDTGVYTYQWGYPNIWAPYQYFAYKALRAYNFETEAEELRINYMRLLERVFESTGALWERYDENGHAKDLEYPTQQMLGWTAGVYRYFYERYF